MPKCPSPSCNVTASCTESAVTSPPFPALRDAEEIKGEYIWRGSPASGSAGSVCHCPLQTGTAGAAAQLPD